MGAMKYVVLMALVSLVTYWLLADRQPVPLEGIQPARLIKRDPFIWRIKYIYYKINIICKAILLCVKRKESNLTSVT